MIITLDRPFSASERGGRAINEDYIYPLSELASAGQRLFMVCDGVGGNARGDVASSLACDSFQTFFDTFFEGGEPTSDFINRAVHYAEARFDDYVAHHPEDAGMATTMTFLYIGRQGITIAHIGDSRIYHFRNGKILRRTDDHSLMSAWLKLGVIKPEDVATHPQRGVVTRAISGAAYSVDADVEYITDIQNGDRFLMCTDGVTACLNDEQLEEIFTQAESAEKIKDALIERCTGKASDNFSFYIIPVREKQKRKGRKKFLASFFSSLP
jgi:protein phosphatase